MPSVTTSTTHRVKPLKWAIQRQPYGKKPQHGNSRPRPAAASSTVKKAAASRHTTSVLATNHTLSPPVLSSDSAPISEQERLERDLAFTYDSLATIIVHLESLQSAYTSSIPDLERDFCPTRLAPKEKELLAAYDDLGLQITHLERKIKKLEARIKELRDQGNASTTTTANMTTPFSTPNNHNFIYTANNNYMASPDSVTSACFEVISPASMSTSIMDSPDSSYYLTFPPLTNDAASMPAFDCYDASYFERFAPQEFANAAAIDPATLLVQ
ncbi:hypothetical protein BC940DRAFT_287399 [Gongronella butleri]|nr:hypothetical protein BC940DRAFT_287399 [Gongronella butleri]